MSNFILKIGLDFQEITTSVMNERINKPTDRQTNSRGHRKLINY